MCKRDILVYQDPLVLSLAMLIPYQVQYAVVKYMLCYFCILKTDIFIQRQRRKYTQNNSILSSSKFPSF